MPVRSLTSSVIKWPDDETVVDAVRRWAREAAETRDNVMRIGCFGSYATGDWGVGSDVDLIVIVSEADRPFQELARDWDSLDLPVPADLLVYTEAEWEAMEREQQRVTQQPIVWVLKR